LLGKRFHHLIYLLSIALLVIGLSTSEFLMSASSIILAANWLLEADFKAKFARLKENKIAVILTFLFFIYVIWMAGTSNMGEGLKELRIRLPLLLFPIVLGSIPRFTEPVLAWIARIFIASTLVSTLISLGVYVEVIPTKADLTDVRNISIFISHIRLSLMICVGMVISIYFIVKRKEHRLIYALTILWFVAFLYLIQSATGYVILFALLGFVALYSLKELKKKALKYGIFLLAAGTFVVGLVYVWDAKESYYEVSEVTCNSPLVATQQGEPYFHDLNNTQLENNNYIWRNIHFESMRAAWNEISEMKVNGKDSKGQPIESTLIRYLTSKGVCKDRDGVEGLSPLDINEIECGNASAVAPKMGVQKRLNEIFWEFDAYANGSNPSGNSVVMRLEFWKTAKAVIGENIWLGVGTGDGKEEMQAMYETTNSVLNNEWRLGSHNEFLSTWVKTGFFGFLIFMIAILCPLTQKKNWNFIYISFFLIAGISFLAENTLETQPGVTFFGFFNCWLLFHGITTKSTKISDKC